MLPIFLQMYERPTFRANATIVFGTQVKSDGNTTGRDLHSGNNGINRAMPHMRATECPLNSAETTYSCILARAEQIFLSTDTLEP
jgi:hypothetical protein